MGKKRKILFHKWQCRKCNFYLSEELKFCPICKIKRKEKKEGGILLETLKKLLILLPKESQRYKNNWQTIVKMRFSLSPFRRIYTITEIAESLKISKQAIHLVLSKARDILTEIGGRD